MEFQFTLKSSMPILFHADDVMAADELKEWRSHKDNKNVSVAGDDRSPPWTWQKYLHHDGTNVAIPQECLMTALRYAGARINVPGKKQLTFKSLSQSGLLIPTDFVSFTDHDKQVAMSSILEFRNEPFSTHIRRCEELGFELLVKRAKVGQSKHVRVRPMFRNWEASGTIVVSEPAITEAILHDMFDIAGRLAGLLDWRPNSKISPGPFGTFTATLKAATRKKAG